MKPTKKPETEALKVYHLYWDSYFRGDLETFATTLDTSFEMIGTSASEICHTKEEGIQYAAAQHKEVVGKVAMRNRQIETVPINGLVLVNEQCAIYALTGTDWHFYSKIRISTLLKETDEGWKVVQQHGSLPDVRVRENETMAFEKISAENLQLRDAVKRRTLELEQKNRELEIEAALERVRSRSLAMHKTAELQSVIHTVHQELLNLNVSISGGSFIVVNSEIDTEIHCWGSGGTADTSDEVHIPYFDKPIYTHLLKGLRSGPRFFTEEYTHEEKIELFSFLFQHEPWSKLGVKEKKETLSAPGGYTRSCAVSKHTSLFIINHFGEKFSEAENAILKRFGKVFEQAYTRFLDLQKAEAQAREAQIEASLERVRAQTMAMHDSEDVGKCVVKMFSELTALGVDEGTRFGIGILNHQNENNQLWTARKNGEEVNMHIGNIDMASHPLLKSAREAWKEQVPLHRYVLEGMDLLNYYQMLNNAPDYKIQIPLEQLPKREIQHCFIFEHGFFYAFSPREFQPELIHITKRFSALFEQTYRRYLDLVRAEAQAREAEIELALERVRARTMAMHHTEELKKIIQVVFDQFVGLNIHVEHAGFILDYKEREDMHIWLADHQQGVPTEITIPYFDSPHWNSYLEARAKEESFFANLLPFKVKNKFYRDLFERIPALTEEAQQAILSKPGLAISTVLLDNVGLYIEHYSETPFTAEENAVQMRFGKVFQQTYTRFLDLQKAEEQARESQIQLALERVRARTMAMQQSDELQDAAILLFQQLKALGMQTGSCGFNIWNKDEKTATVWMSSAEGGFQTPFVLPHTESAMYKQVYEAMKNGQMFLVKEVGGKNLKKHFDYLLTLPGIGEVIIKLRETGYAFPETMVYHFAFFSQGYLSFHLHEHHPETHDIFKRFAKVFEQTYTRFLDLQKAEAQAREARIEAALERVRSRTMAMQSSAELGAVAAELFAQMNQLVTNLWTCGFVLCEKDRDEDEWWLSMDGDFTRGFFLPNVGDYAHATLYEGWLKGEALRAVQLDGVVLQQHYDWLMEIPVSRAIFEEMDAAGLARPDWQKLHAAYFSKGYLVLITREPCEQEEIFRRFAQVFDQTYTRFLDLQKAEAQAREAQIQLALERVRARTMAMQSSDELAEVSYLLNKQVVELGIPTRGCAFNIYDENDSTEWFSNLEGTLSAYKTPREKVFLNYYEAGKRGETILIEEYSGKKIQDHYQYLFSAGIFGKGEVTEEKIKEITPAYQIDHVAYFKYGYLLFITLVPAPDAHDVFKRFAKEFEQTYTRFLDLQKAEAQAREAQIEAALERVRSRNMGMQSSEELPEVANLLFTEVRALGIHAWSCGYNILADDKKTATCCMSSEGTMQTPFQLRLWGEASFDEMGDFIHSENAMLVQELGGKALEAHYAYMKSFQDLKPTFDQIDALGLSLPTYQINHLCKFTGGFILFITYEKVPDSHEVFKRFTIVFDQTYTRFLDLKKAEAQALRAEQDLIEIKAARQKAEEALTELKATQSQLVQSEKMASLGELTAGIAHEIQNPLNFVNNFSEVSTELVDEMNEELEKGNTEDAKQIASDLKQNLEKINHHGKRAGDIVKGMLQHSRSSSGVKEPTDINALADEYLRLAYHGLRAKDKSFNATMKTDFDESIGSINVVPQDIGRVILNLITNAFYVVNERQKAESSKLKAEGASFEPTVSVSTKKSGDKILISVKDNGNGIQEHIKDKIFQPFFTTKPTGQGTGLGLSLSYDIVKAHGGELTVESKEGDGSKFLIYLPIV